MGLLGGVPLVAVPVVEPAPAAGTQSGSGGEPKLRCAVIGLGRWGREITTTLSRLTNVELVALCDHYPSSLRRGARLAPEAKLVESAAKVLEDGAVQAIFVATPSHDHRDVTVRALTSGRHVYCEAPIATRVADAAAMARAARTAAPRWVFQAGLQGRSDPQRRLAAGFFSSGVAGKLLFAQAQWHLKQSWRQAAASAERKHEVNWRLDSGRSLGLAGEVAVHHLDAASWFFGARPLAISGQGSLLHWKDDGRDVADTVQLVVEYPDGLRLADSCTLANSFGAETELFCGTDAAILFRGGRAWMFREVDAPQLEWEVHARQETFHDQKGLVLVANASKQKATDTQEDPIEAALAIPPLQHSLQAFVQSALDIEAAVEDFTGAYGSGNPVELREHLAAVPRAPGAGWQQGFEAVVMAVKAQEAITSGQRIELEPRWFELG